LRRSSCFLFRVSPAIQGTGIASQADGFVPACASAEVLTGPPSWPSRGLEGWLIVVDLVDYADFLDLANFPADNGYVIVWRSCITPAWGPAWDPDSPVM